MRFCAACLAAASLFILANRPIRPGFCRADACPADNPAREEKVDSIWSVLFLCYSFVLCFYDLIIGVLLHFVNPKSHKKAIHVYLRHFDE